MMPRNMRISYLYKTHAHKEEDREPNNGDTTSKIPHVSLSSFFIVIKVVEITVMFATPPDPDSASQERCLW